MVGLIKDFRDGGIAPAQFGELIEVLTAVAWKDDAVGWLRFDPGKENSLAPQRTTLGSEAGVVVCQHFR
ncbi:MAG: hypothetical protein Q4B08_10830 [Propionibacteriaceae bacterium]|nr:hypothetical protein [Propionibacteriaceae bacterium]